MTTDTRYEGTVKWFGDNGRHFGFIVPGAGGPDVFVHISAAGRAGMREIKRATGWNIQSKSTSAAASRALPI